MPAPTAKTPTRFHPFAGRDLPWLLDRQAAARPDKPFIIWEPSDGATQTWTYAEFALETHRVAAGLAARGVGEGEAVVIHLDNCPEFLFAWFGCSRLGAVAVTTNTRSTADELGYFIAHSRAVAAITQPRHLEVVRAAGDGLRWIACTAADADQPATVEIPSGVLRFADLRGDPASAPARPPEPLARNSIQYTSGTTSRPKGVVWTHANALWSATVNSAHARLTEDDVALFYFPLFHTNAMGWTVLATLGAGGTAVMLPRFSSRRFWEVARRHRCTWANMVMFTLRALTNAPDPEGHHFRFWACAADLAFVHQKWGIKTIGWFGMTETVSQTAVSDFEAFAPERCMGRPVPEYETAIRRDDGAEVAVGETGNLWIRGVPGVSMFLEYLDDPTATAAAFDTDGWFETGDQVMPLPDGHLMFQGRAKDMLRVGGENVAALEIEGAVMRVPGVLEVAVVGRPDPMLDEVPVAFVVARQPGAELAAEIKAHCDSALSDFKRPRDVRFVDELPKGLLDKVLKKELRARLIAETEAVA
jgi:carnitine-CoA ligase